MQMVKTLLGAISEIPTNAEITTLTLAIYWHCKTIMQHFVVNFLAMPCSGLCAGHKKRRRRWLQKIAMQICKWYD